MKIKIFIPILIITFIIGLTVGKYAFADKPKVSLKLNNLVSENSAEKDDTPQPQANTEINNNNNSAENNAKEDNHPQKPQSESIPEQPKQKYAYVQQKHNYVNVRKGPGLNYPILTKVNKGIPMLIIEEKDKWYRVKLEDGSYAWVANWVVDVKEE